MTEVNLSGNAKQHAGACAIDPKLSPGIEALLKIAMLWRIDYAAILSNISGIFGGPCRFGYKGADGKAGIPNESINDY
jgi:hypothetical protein